MQSPEKIAQCKGLVEDMKKIFNEGCQIYGYMEVNRVSGSFHIAPGKSFSISHVHGRVLPIGRLIIIPYLIHLSLSWSCEFLFLVHDVQPYSSNQFNMTHRVKSLSFGESIPGI